MSLSNSGCNHFLDCVASGDTPRTDGREGLRVLKVLQAAQDALDADLSAMSEDNAKYPGVFIHESAYVDEPCEIGEGTKILTLRAFLATQRSVKIVCLAKMSAGKPSVSIDDNCKVQNNVSLYKGVTLEDGVCGYPACSRNVITRALRWNVKKRCSTPL